MTDDPFAVLGVDRAATADEIRAAHRKLAKQHHPDVGGDPARMRVVNGAVEAALVLIGERPAPAGSLATQGSSAAPTSPERPSTGSGTTHHLVVDEHGRRVLHDTASFTIEALPAEAFEALLVATSWIGEVMVDDPPYLLEVHITEPPVCWCRLELVPDAGASTVSLTVAPVEVGPMPDLDAVRDLWVASLNGLDWDRLGEGPLDRSWPSRP